ncbi:ALF repeat-containing protein [Kitasatospora sp. CM 4170]|uniref:ALF repeat-containing protein n=1 Tax=Kitasatospora aburaviensis TaxID=67265 RepID=A0ABW1F1G3_9ACTN|nr:ALF repeat-containing protein [Kitasatospora sp. CM 4170]WNM49290.1 ALF repeat-containing protein [Kitasatospora sp. CM 4170]
MAAVAVWMSGGPAVRRAAELALTGSDADVHAFVAGGRAAAADQDLRAKVEELVAVSGPGVREKVLAALAVGTPAALQDFLGNGSKAPFEHDQRVLLSQIQYAGGPGVRDAAKEVPGTTRRSPSPLRRLSVNEQRGLSTA